MKFRFHWAQALVLGLALLAAGCLEKDPYDRFAGTWVYARFSGEHGPLVALDLDPAHKKLTISILGVPRNEDDWVFIEHPIKEMELRDGSLALNVDNSSIRGIRGVPEPALFDSLVLEPLDDDSLLAKPYFEEIPPAMLLSGKAGRPGSILELTRPSREQKKLLSQIEPSPDIIKRDWYLENSWAKPALSFDKETGKIKIRNARLIDLWGDTTLTPTCFVEVREDDTRMAGLLFARASRNGRVEFSINVDEEPLQATFRLRGESFHLLPEMSGAERQRYAQAKEDARREAARKELEAQQRAEAQAAEARREAEERQRKAEEEARIAAEKARAEEAARQKALAEKRAKMPQFSFGDIRLTDTPQQMVQKGMERYKLATSFPVQQKDGTITSVKNPSIGYLPFLLEDPGISEALGGKERVRMTVGYRKWGSEETGGYFLGPDKTAIQAGVRPDVLIMRDKTRNDPTSTIMEIGFYTLPGKAPTALYLNVDGGIVVDAVSVFKERYGEPESVVSDGDRHQYIWRSGDELAILKVDPQEPGYRQQHQLYIVSLPAYAELEKFTQDQRQAEEAKKKAAEEAERAARKAGI